MRIAVVGAGIVGVSTAEWLRRDGHRVVLIDPLPPGDPGQASFGNAGLIARAAVLPVAEPGMLPQAVRMLLDRDGPLFLRWQYLPRLVPWLVPFLRQGTAARFRQTAAALADLVHDAVDQHLALAAGTPAAALITRGEYVHLFRDRADWLADRLGREVRAGLGQRWDERGRGALNDADPHLGPGYGFGIAYPDHAWIRDPGAYVAALAAHFAAAGGQRVAGRVIDIAPRMGGGARLLLADGRVPGTDDAGFDQVVLAAGAWSARLARRLGHRAMLESERGYHLMLAGATRRPPVPYLLSDSRLVATPMDHGLRAAGLLEFGGLAAPARAAPPRLIARALRRLYPDLAWTGETVWLGHRPSTIDSLPMLGESPRAPGVWLAFGAHHVGLTTGPKTGRLIADLIGGRRCNIDLAPFAVGRFD